MRTVSLAALTAVLLSGSAYAADIYNQGGSAKDTPGAFDASDRVNWTGFYFGGQVGYGISSHSTTTIESFPGSVEEIPSQCWGKFDGEYRRVDSDPTPSITNTSKSDLSGDEEISLFPINVSLIKTNVESQEDCDAYLSGVRGSAFGQSYTQDQTYSTDPRIGRHDLAGTATHGYNAAETVTTDPYSEKSVHSGSDSGLVGGARLGFDYAMGRFLVGAFGEYNWSAVDGKDSDWSAGGRAGILLSDRVLAYGLVAYTQADYGDVDFTGISVGGGLEYALSRNIFLGMEYAHTFYDEETLVDVPGFKVTDELDEDRIMATLKVKLNGGGLPNFAD
jgi:opacity protein-like surface antigen